MRFENCTADAPKTGPSPGHRRVLLLTEGTYPFHVGGVSSWCDLLVNGLPEVDWTVLPIIGGGTRPNPLFDLPPQARLAAPIVLWSEELPQRRKAPGALRDLPATLVRHLLGWRGDAGALVDALVACRGNSHAVRRAFRAPSGWETFLPALRETLAETGDGLGGPPTLDALDAVRLYQTLYWIARTAAYETPRADLSLVTAAGWASVPAVVDQALHGTPIVLAEHGIYVREAYLTAARGRVVGGERWLMTRLARGLTRLAYARADVVAPVTEANSTWETSLGVDPSRIRVIVNGVEGYGDPAPAPRTKTVVSVGRIDPLKDVHTMLRVADDVLRRIPDAQFLHYGPVTAGEEAYGRGCRALHRRLGLDDRFRFMGRTTDPHGVVRDADVVLMTSISEGLPLAILEAMGQGRPVVSTWVGGVRDVVVGCGTLAAPGDVHALGSGVATLLQHPRLAAELGRRGHARAARMFSQRSCLDGYRQLFEDVAPRRLEVVS